MKSILTSHFPVLILTLLTLPVASAQTPPPEKYAPRPRRQISFDELRDRCLKPAEFPDARAPSNLVVQCTQTRIRWISAAAGLVPLPSSNQFTASIQGNRYEVPPMQFQLAVPTQAGQCVRFKEVKESFTFERPISCHDLIELKGGLEEYCPLAASLIQEKA